MPYLDLQTHRLFYRHHGSGPALVFLHGLSFDSRMWEAQYEYFEDEYMVLGLDFRGHGFSDAPDIRYSFNTFISDINGLLNALHIHTAVFVGLSLGGAVALEFALQYPQRTRAMLLASSALAGYPWSQAWRDVMRRIHQAENLPDLRKNLRKYWLSDPMFANIRSDMHHAKLLRQMAAGFSGKPILNSDINLADQVQSTANLAKISCPVSVVSGKEDRTDFRAIARKLATEIPRSEWHQLAGTGHMINLESPGKFNEILEQFLLRVDSGGI